MSELQETPEAQSTQSDSDSNDSASTAKGLLKEKIHFRNRAQVAEQALAELQSQHDSSLKAMEKLTGKLKTFEFKESKEALLSKFITELPETQKVKDADKLRKYVDKFSNPETLEQDIKDILPDFIAEAQAQVEQKTEVKQPNVIPFTGTASKQTDLNANKTDYHSLAELYKTNPQAYESLMNKKG